MAAPRDGAAPNSTPPATSNYRDTLGWYLGVSAYWFAVSMKWFLLYMMMPFLVDDFVKPGQVNLWWGRISGVGAVEAMLGPAVFGYLSDRTLSRFGRRRPYIAVGAAMTAVALVAAGHAGSLAGLFGVYLLIQVSDDVATGPYAALVPDMVPEHRRGRASGILSQLQLVAQVFAAGMGLALGSVETLLIGVAAVNVVCAAIVLAAVREVPAARAVRTERRAGLAAALGGVDAWVAPWRDGDFRWVWLTRFLNALGFYIVLNYMAKYLEDVVRVFDLPGLRLEDPLKAAITLALFISVAGAVGAVWGGNASDRVGRKYVVIVSGALMFAMMIPFALLPDFLLFAALSPIFGFGYGAYLSATWALAADILPNKDDAAKDMGIWQASVTTPQVVAGFAIGATIDWGNTVRGGLGYTAAFLFAAVTFLTGSVLVRRVKRSF